MEIFRITRNSCPTDLWHPVPILFSSKDSAKLFIKDNHYFSYHIEQAMLDVFPLEWTIILKKEKQNAR
jgi:hypothetical protein